MAQHILDLFLDYWVLGFIGFSIGSLVALWNMGRLGLSFPRALVILIAGIYAALFGTRMLTFLIEDPGIFVRDPLGALAFWQGGLSWQGGFPLALAVILALAWIFRSPAWTTAGAMAPGVALAHAFSRFGCLAQGCCYGRPTDVPWAIYSHRLGELVHPTQYYSMVAELLNFALLEWLFLRHPASRRFLYPLYGVIFALHRFVQEFYRGVPAGPELITGLRVYQVICLIILVASLDVILLMLKKGWATVLACLLTALLAASFFVFRPPPGASGVSGRAGGEFQLVAARSMFAKALEAQREIYAAQDLEMKLLLFDAAPTSRELARLLRQQGRLARGVLIVGDAAGPGEEGAPWRMPVVERVFKAGGREVTVHNDTLYGDLDQDGIPDIPVGRLAVRDSGQVRLQAEKLGLRASSTPVPQGQRALVWAGAGGYQEEIHNLALNFSQVLKPAWLDAFLILSRQGSRFNPPAKDQAGIFLEELARPLFLSLVISHGGFSHVELGEEEGAVARLTVQDVGRLGADRPSGPMFILACEAGVFSAPGQQGPGLAEALANHAGGPVAVIAAGGAVSPLTNYFMAQALASELARPHVSVGGLFTAALARVLKKGGLSMRALAAGDQGAQALIRAVPRGEQGLLDLPGLLGFDALHYNLLGDPAAPLFLPRPVKMNFFATRSGSIRLWTKARPGLDQAWASRVSPAEKQDRLTPGLEAGSRRGRFLRANAPPQGLGRWDLDPQAENIEIQLAVEPGYYDTNDYLRLFLAGPAGLYYYIFEDRSQSAAALASQAAAR